MNQQNVFINFVYSRVINGEQTYKAGTARILLLRFTWYALLWAPLLRTKSSGASSLPLGLWRDLRDGLDMRRPAVLFIPELLQTKKIKIEKINYQFQYIYGIFTWVWSHSAESQKGWPCVSCRNLRIAWRREGGWGPVLEAATGLECCTVMTAM